MRTIRARFTILTSLAVIISVLSTIMIVYYSVKKYISTESYLALKSYYEAEIKSGMEELASIIIVSILLLVVIFIVITYFLAERITRPLKELTKAAAALDAGNYDVEIRYDADDEVGILARAFIQMRSHIRTQIGSLNAAAYKDPLTSVRNKTAFDAYTEDMDALIASPDKSSKPEFAVWMFDCNDLKEINDGFGHDKGDMYLKATCRLICDVFRHSAVFRVGGDEFVAVLLNSDYEMREELGRIFRKKANATIADGNDPWNRISVAGGMSAFDPEEDTHFADVLKRADEQMYEEKKLMKDNADKMLD